MALTYCDWCGAYCECEKCDDPAVKKAWWEMDNPMQHHIHSCCDEHECYWEHPHYWTEREGDEPELCTGCNYGQPDCKCGGTDDSTRGDRQDMCPVCDGPLDDNALCTVCERA